MELERETGKDLRLWGGLEGAWPFAPGSGGFYKQHSPSRTPDGTLLVSTWLSAEKQELVAREYEIDDAQQVLRQVWSCGAGSGIEAPYSGETHRLPNGNTLLNYGPGGHLREYLPDCTVAWEVAWSDGTRLRRSSLLADLYTFAP